MARCALLLLAASLAYAQPYDLLLKNGTVIDPRNGVNARRDVAIAGGRIADVAKSIPASRAAKTVDVTGMYVAPGLVDMHVHVYAGTGKPDAWAGDLSVYPDTLTLPCGVTTVVDAGSAGARNFADFRDKVIVRARTRVFAFVNIVGAGMAGGDAEQNTGDMDARAAASCALGNRGVIVGIKTAHYQAADWTAVDRAVQAGRVANLPVMVDFGAFLAERPYEELVGEHLRAGDISTHTFHPQAPMLDAQNRVRAYLFEARKRGVVFDTGHGAGSFVFRQAARAVQQGFYPDTISTDLHVASALGGMKNMLNVMSKFLNLGMPIEEVVRRSTWNPAQVIHHEEVGHLSVGGPGDIAVLRVASGDFGFTDAMGARLRGNRRIECELTVRDGKIVWDLNGLSGADWNSLGLDYGPQGDARWDATVSPRLREREKSRIH